MADLDAPRRHGAHIAFFRKLASHLENPNDTSREALVEYESELLCRWKWKIDCADKIAMLEGGDKELWLELLIDTAEFGNDKLQKISPFPVHEARLLHLNFGRDFFSVGKLEQILENAIRGKGFEPYSNEFVLIVPPELLEQIRVVKISKRDE